jgi:hypothetical protein
MSATTMNPRLVAARSAIVRAAEELGYPDGYAPPEKLYSRWRDPALHPASERVRKWAGMVPWAKAMRRLNLRPAGELSRWRGEGDAPPLSKPELRKAMVADLKRVAMVLERPRHIPAPLKYRELGRFADHMILRELGRLDEGAPSWFNVAMQCNLLPNRGRNHFWTRDRVLYEYKAVARRLGRVQGGPGLTAAEVALHIVGPRTVTRLVGGVNDLAEMAGFTRWPSGYTRRAAARLHDRQDRAA